MENYSYSEMSSERRHIDPKRYRHEEYVARINRVIDYIEANIGSQLTPAELADVACFSRFHFHRIFAALIGETLHQFIKRVRIEKAATMLVFNPKKSITEVAFDCGFTGSATFARAFKQAYGISAGAWRTGAFKAFCEDIGEKSKNCKVDRNNEQTISKNRKDFDISPSYFDSGTNFDGAVGLQSPTHRRRNAMSLKKQLRVSVETLPEQTVVYVRHIGPYQGDATLFERLYTKLFSWAGPRGLLNFPRTKAICVYHDNPEITDENKLRTSVCITAPSDTEIDGDIGKMTLAAGKYALARFELKPDEYGEAWRQVYGEWLPDSGYQPDDRPCFELYHNNCTDHPEKIAVLDICVPVKPL
ncbi:MAG: helix-turn-helix domain-containing protein [Chitinivibrionales bacterium]|nr:helix-turn-helix domain-containing protein [Chitinivibrionales bacterium]